MTAILTISRTPAVQVGKMFKGRKCGRGYGRRQERDVDDVKRMKNVVTLFTFPVNYGSGVWGASLAKKVLGSTLLQGRQISAAAMYVHRHIFFIYRKLQ